MGSIFKHVNEITDTVEVKAFKKYVSFTIEVDLSGVKGVTLKKENALILAESIINYYKNK